MDCIFCKIINNEFKSFTIYEDEIVKVILDVNPKHNGHCLILPKKHYINIFDIESDTLSHIMNVAKDISNTLKEKLRSDGITLVQNNGIAQEVKHFHLHVIPKYKSENFMDVKDVYEILK